jgi:hypothetical protein
VKIKLVVLNALFTLAALSAYGPAHAQATPSQNPQEVHQETIPQVSRIPEDIPPKEVWINIFVHGIMSIKPHLNISNFMRFMVDDVLNTTYSKTVELMRRDCHFYQNQAMQGFGFHKVDPTAVNPGNASSALAAILDDVTALSQGPHIENHYYTFGWSGLMSHTKRYQDAIDLYKHIEKEVKAFQDQGINPRVRLYGYSHGGNVVLNLGAVRQKEAVRKDLVIDEVLLLGTPIQRETDYLVNDQVFGKIYNIYSTSDRVQKMDFFSLHRLFSRRIFSDRSDFILPKKLVQIQLKITRLTPSARCNKKKKAATFNFDSSAIISGKSHLLRDSSPGHGELWFFGWTPSHYRPHFVLNPLPAVAIAPFILKTVQEIEHLLLPEHPVIFDMRPEHGITLIKNVKSQTFYKIVDFLPEDELIKLQAKAQLYTPDSYTSDAYSAHVKQAYDKAHNHYQGEWSLKARRKQHFKTRKERSQARREARKEKKHNDELISPSLLIH